MGAETGVEPVGFEPENRAENRMNQEIDTILQASDKKITHLRGFL